MDTALNQINVCHLIRQLMHVHLGTLILSLVWQRQVPIRTTARKIVRCLGVQPMAIPSQDALKVPVSIMSIASVILVTILQTAHICVLAVPNIRALTMDNAIKVPQDQERASALLAMVVQTAKIATILIGVQPVETYATEEWPHQHSIQCQAYGSLAMATGSVLRVKQDKVTVLVAMVFMEILVSTCALAPIRMTLHRTTFVQGTAPVWMAAPDLDYAYVTRVGSGPIVGLSAHVRQVQQTSLAILPLDQYAEGQVVVSATKARKDQAFVSVAYRTLAQPVMEFVLAQDHLFKMCRAQAVASVIRGPVVRVPAPAWTDGVVWIAFPHQFVSRWLLH